MQATVITKTICNRSFKALDPATYPYANGCFDEEEPIHAIWCEMGDGKRVVDVGACFGAFTLPALAAGAEVVAFEPSDDGVRILAENVRANGWLWRATLKRCAVFDGWRYPQELHDDVFGRSYPAKDVRYSTLDIEVGGRIDAIKIDVEGGELGVLQGATRILRLARPLLLIEDHDGIDPGKPGSDYPQSIGSREKITSMLTSLGYSVERREWSCNRSYLIARA